MMLMINRWMIVGDSMVFQLYQNDRRAIAKGAIRVRKESFPTLIQTCNLRI